MEMAEVKAFNAELSSLYDNRPPISKAKMGAITRGAIKAIKFYKHVVHSVEKFILKCKPEYKIPGLYVIDSIVRQSRHQFGPDKDVFAPRFAKNMQQTFVNLLRCPPEDRRNIIRVLNLWQKNSVFGPEVIQPLFDMAHPDHPIHQELLNQQPSHANGSSSGAEPKSSPAGGQHTPNVSQSADQLRQIQHSLRAHDLNSAAQQQTSVNFNRRLLNVDFEYESEDDGITGDSSPMARSNSVSQPNQTSAVSAQQNQQSANSFLSVAGNLQPMHQQDTLGSILTNPEILRHLQSLQTQMMMTNFQMQSAGGNLPPELSFIDTSQPPPLMHPKMEDNTSGTSPLLDEVNNESDIEFVDDAGPQVIEIDGNDSSPSPKTSRRRRSRSRDYSRRSRSRSRKTSRSRSRDRRRRSRDRSRDRYRDRARDREREKEREKEKEKEKEKERERRKKGLPPIKKDTLSVCSTTLWVGHLSKLVQAEELSDSFGAIGDVVSIDLVPPRGCAFIVMNRRRDASRAITKLDKHKMHGKAITVAWAPGKGVKGREWKDFWEAEVGACYIPWLKLPVPGDINGLSVLETLEEGGVLDEETVPSWLQKKVLGDKKTLAEQSLAGLIPPNQSGMVVMSPLQPPQNMGVDTTCLPPPLAQLGFPPHPGLSMPLPLLGFKPSTINPQPGLQQALHLQAVIAHQQQQQIATQLLLAPPPRLPHPLTTISTPLQSSFSNADQDDAMELETNEETMMNSDSAMPKPDPMKSNSLHDDSSQLSEKLKALVANPPPAFNIPPPLMSAPSLLGKPPLLPGQPFPGQIPPLLNPNNDDRCDPALLSSNDIKDKDSRRDRDNGRRDRDRRDRDRDRTRERHDRDRDRGERDRERDRVDKDRDRPGRERNNRWAGRDHRENNDMSPGSINRHSGVIGNAPERSLQDRLWEMANGPGLRPHRGESPPRGLRNNDHLLDDEHIGDSLLGDGPMDIDPRQGIHMGNHRELSPTGMMGPGGPIGGPPMGPMGSHGPMGMMGPNMNMMGRSPLRPMTPFRINRDEMRMRPMGPRGPPMRSNVWMDGPNQYGPRFNGGPPYNRPYDGPYDRYSDGPPYEQPLYDRPTYDGPPHNQYDGPPYDNPRYDNHPDEFYERGGPRNHRVHRNMDGRRMRGDRDNDNRGDRRGSRWAGDNPEKSTKPNNHKEPNNADVPPKNRATPANPPAVDDKESKKPTETKENSTDEIKNNVSDIKASASPPEETPSNVHSEKESVKCDFKADSDEPFKERFEESVENKVVECDDRAPAEAPTEGRGTPCRDEPVEAATVSDLDNP